jgi:hypothetical protein
MFAELRGLTPVAAQQIEYSLVHRTPEWELLSMADAFGSACHIQGGLYEWKKGWRTRSPLIPRWRAMRACAPHRAERRSATTHSALEYSKKSR